jgi:cobaltochelatase CobS
MSLIKCSDRTRRDNGCHCHNDKNVYWAHDTDRTIGKGGFPLAECGKCGATGRYVLINANEYTRGTKRGQAVREIDRHTKDGVNVSSEEPSDIDIPATPEPEADVPAAFTPANDHRIDSLTQIVVELSGKVATLTAQLNPPRILPKVSHYALPEVMINLETRVHTLMVGPAGTGKSVIAKQAAEALGLPYFELSLSAGMTPTAIQGYMQATGEYVTTLFRKAYENGGVFHFDEFDNGAANTIGVVNAALAGDRAAFPDGMVMRHKDFVCVASANTFGRGPDREYVGRQQLDAATLDRFVVEEILIDEDMESLIAEGIGYAHTADVVRYIRSIRANAAAFRMPVIISPRAVYDSLKLLKAGKSWDATINARLRKGLSDTDWSKLTTGVYRPASV